jgi:hypothetical protein
MCPNTQGRQLAGRGTDRSSRCRSLGCTPSTPRPLRWGEDDPSHRGSAPPGKTSHTPEKCCDSGWPVQSDKTPRFSSLPSPLPRATPQLFLIARSVNTRLFDRARLREVGSHATVGDPLISSTRSLLPAASVRVGYALTVTWPSAQLGDAATWCAWKHTQAGEVKREVVSRVSKNRLGWQS